MTELEEDVVIRGLLAEKVVDEQFYVSNVERYEVKNSRLEIEQFEVVSKGAFASIKMDGKVLDKVRSVDIHVEVGSLPVVKVEFVGNKED